ncbi:radical SAM domain protein [Treponema primitia ZAS-2]|uniref:Radical SAM domain protein n=1 Tax=Treponema primitia (strain ATCC BAA-887 / DSM 12427 / ZAS-2) TaxID=545694 RepID=F5YJJ1_TREPZ|nr:radical SAM protein [Treponema primitia]AEF85985.1 radical SAM domain protein [Treponema primitia ZAS-2]
MADSTGPGPYRLDSCELCPRRCGADRVSGSRGFCGESAEIRIAAASIHRGEEPPITGQGGSGTIFFTGCTLGCSFCQNHQISHAGMGRIVDETEFVRICLALQERGAENINLVTGSHHAPGIARFLRTARKQGLNIPLLWNSSAYEGPEALSPLENLIDVYLPDLKTLDAAVSARFFKAPDYPEAAEQAILRMLEYRGELRWEDRGTETPVLVSGVMIRHLVLPGYLASTRRVLQWFAEHCQGRALLSLMTQYTPVGPDPSKRPDGYVGQDEYGQILEWLEEYGIEDGFCQELVPDDSWLPDFKRANPFSSELSEPVWHWGEGFIRRPS